MTEAEKRAMVKQAIMGYIMNQLKERMDAVDEYDEEGLDFLLKLYKILGRREQ